MHSGFTVLIIIIIAYTIVRRLLSSKQNGVSRPIPNSNRANPQVVSLNEISLPAIVAERIAKEKAQNLPWTSALSVNDWLLLRKYQLRPLRLVMGTAYFHFGYSENFYVSLGIAGEITQVEAAIYQSCHTALKRMAEEAKLLGAHAVVGVKLIRKKEEDGEKGRHSIEYTFVGTAVALDGENKPEEPIICTVSVPEFAKLVEAGSMPLGLALGIGVYYQYSNFSHQWAMSSWSNQEIIDFSNASYHVRQLAMQGMMHDLKQLGGHGILAHDTSLKVTQIEVERGENDKRIDHLLEFFSMGTVVATAAHHPIPKFKSAIALN